MKLQLLFFFFSGWTKKLSGIIFPSGSNVLCALIINGGSSGDLARMWKRYHYLFFEFGITAAFLKETESRAAELNLFLIILMSD